MIRKWLQITGGTIGLVVILVMLLANQLGLDNNPVWGAKRYIIFLLGILLLAVSIFYREENFIGRAFHTYRGQLYLAVVLLSAFIILVYIWFISIGLWTSWPNETSYYNLLADAFTHGQTAMDVQPDPAFLTLENIYEPQNREGIPVLWDASLYNGKYYLYWGPTPAILLALIKPFHPQEVGDNVLTFAFILGTFIFMALLILNLWEKYFSETPRWLVLLGLVFAGLVNPMLYILTEARIYEAAIISGQFFLIGGLYWLITSFDRPSNIRLALSGLFFALAVGSRTTLIPAVAILSLILLIWALKTQREKALVIVTLFAIPLMIGAVSYGLYNYTRFNSFTEFGLRYQLTSYNLQKDLDKTFSTAYIAPNLYKTLFNPLEWRKSFPHLFPTRWDGPDWLANLNYPNFYLLFAEGITGLFIASPFMIFAFLAGLNKNKDFHWILLSLAGASILTFLTLQIFFFTTMRYLLDLTPALSILAVVGFWQGFASLKHSKIARSSFALSGIALSTYTIFISLILPISGHLEAYKTYNPELLIKLANLIQ